MGLYARARSNMSDIRELINTMHQEEDTILNKRDTRTVERSTNTSILVILLTLLSLGALLYLLYYPLRTFDKKEVAEKIAGEHIRKLDKEAIETWRPSVICISKDSFKRTSAFELMRWISDRYGFGTYLHYIVGYVSNPSLMILLSYVIAGHRDWKKAQIKIFAIFPEKEIDEENERLVELIEEGRLPIARRNVELIPRVSGINDKKIINEKSKEADLTIIGFRSEVVKQLGNKVFKGYNSIGNILFVNSINEKEIF